MIIVADKLKKGDRIFFDDKGFKKFGIVGKGGAKRCTIILDGAKEQVTGGPQCFELSDHPIAHDLANHMDKYAIINWKEIRGDETRNFNAVITKNGKPYLDVSNEGHGGPNIYYYVGNKGESKNRDETVAFYKECQEWAKMFGDEDPRESDDIWVEWWQFMKPYGKTAKMYWDENDAESKVWREVARKKKAVKAKLPPWRDIKPKGIHEENLIAKGFRIQMDRIGHNKKIIKGDKELEIDRYQYNHSLKVLAFFAEE